MACALLALMAVDREGAGLPSPMPIAMMLSNQDNAVFATGGAQTRENHLAGVTFGWTNGSVFQSSIRFTPTTI
jgi:chorismate synthase